MRGRKGLVIAAALLVAGAAPALASDVYTIPISDAPPGTPALGGGIRLTSNPLIGDLDEWDLVPLYLYEGKYLFAHGTEFGAHLFRNDTFQVNALAPGATLTERTMEDKDYAKIWKELTPMGRAGRVEDIANAAMFLLSKEASHITGQALVIDGGWSAVSPYVED